MKKHHIYQVITGATILIVMPIIFANNTSTFSDFATKIASEGLITAQENPLDYEFFKQTSLKEIAAIALNLSQIQSPLLNSAPDGSDWETSVISTASSIGIISPGSSMTADRAVTRVEAFAMIMKSVCLSVSLDEDTSSHSWQKNVYDLAYSHGLTTRSWSTFEPENPILRQELFVIVSRAADWAKESPLCGDAENVGLPFGQTPNTFVLRFSTKTHDIYSFIVAQNWPVSLVQEKYAQLNSTDSSSISVVDDTGKSLDAALPLRVGHLVYAYVPKQIEEDSSPLKYIIDLPFGQESGTFVQRFETVDEKIYSHVVDHSGDTASVQVLFISYIDSTKQRWQITVRDEHGRDIDARVILQKGQLVYVYVQK